MKPPSVGARKDRKHSLPLAFRGREGALAVCTAFSVVAGPVLVLVLCHCWDWRWCWCCPLSVVLDAGVVCCSWCRHCLLSVVFGVVCHLGRWSWRCCDVGIGGLSSWALDVVECDANVDLPVGSGEVTSLRGGDVLTYLGVVELWW